MQNVLRVLAVTAVAFLPLNAVRIFPGIPVGDGVLAAMVAIVVLRAAFSPIARSQLGVPWVLAGAALSVSVALTSLASSNTSASLSMGGRLLFAAWVLPSVFRQAFNRDVSGVLMVAVAFVIGVSVSGGWAILASATGSGLRSNGLAVHPNHLATTCALAFPVALYLGMGTAGRLRAVGSLAIAALLLAAVLASGSRAGLVGLAVGGGATLVLEWRRPGFGRLLPAVVLFAFLGLWLSNRAGFDERARMFIAVERLLDPSAARTSDDARAEIRRRSLDAIGDSPGIGMGWDRSRDAHNLVLQLLEAGGVIGLVTLIAAVSVPVFAPQSSLFNDHALATGVQRAALVAIIVWLVVGIWQNVLIDRYLYVPVALRLAGRRL